MDICCRISDKVSPSKNTILLFFKKTPPFWPELFFCAEIIFLISQYLLAMALTYFKRAGLSTSEYTRLNLFTALYVP